MNFRGLYIALWLFMLPVLMLSQTGNPFEIKSRKSLAKPVEKTEVRVQPTQKDSASQIVDKRVKPATPVTQAEASDPAAEEEEPIADDTTSPELYSPDNPFEIKPERSKIEAGSNTQRKGRDGITPKVAVDTKTTKHINFIFWLILFSLIVLAFPVSIDRWYVLKIFRSLFNYNISNTLARDLTGFNVLLFSLLYLVFIISFSVFVFLSIQHFGFIEGTLRWFLLTLLIVLSIYLVRHISLLITKWIFPEIIELHAFNFTILSFNAVLGIALIIPNLLLAFSPEGVARISFFAGIGIILFIYVIRSFRGVLISFKYIYSNPIHFFLYLCTFEILPLLTIYKLTIEFI